MTMSAVSKEANCSKETIYNWFGDRDGLLLAAVQWQASKVREPLLDLTQLDFISLEISLKDFAFDLLSVLSSETSVALNRAAIFSAGTDNGELGAVVLENGRRAMGRRLKPVLEAGRDANLLNFKDSEEAFRDFFGLIVRDVQIRLLLGEELSITINQIKYFAVVSTKQFLKLYKS
jgi:AcrR family transcriptional regulator